METVNIPRSQVVTIDRESFMEAVKKADEKFQSLGEKKEGKEMAMFMMSLQNVMFGALIAEVLFDGEKEDK